MDEETAASLFSLTRVMAASAVGVLVNEGTITFNTPLIAIIPDPYHHDPTIQNETTLRDLLTHCVGWVQLNTIWTQDQGRLYLDKILSLITAAALLVAAGFREKFQYNNWNYGLVALAAARPSGLSLGAFREKEFFASLAMGSTSAICPQNAPSPSEGYIVTSHGDYQTIDRPHVADDKIVSGANEVDRCAQDLLVSYNAITDASEHSEDDNPFKISKLY